MVSRVVVVGGGVMGSSAAWHLARRDHEVTLLEQYDRGHDRGSSHGSSRIFRLAYPDPFYVHLASRALPLWRELEREAGASVLTTTGALDHGPVAATTALHDALTAAGRTTAQFLRPGEVSERWPGLRADVSALFHPEGGRLHADAAVAALQRAAEHRGAQLRQRTRVQRITRQTDERVEVITAEQESIVADAVVVAVGGWAPATLPGLVTGLPRLRVTQEQPVHFPVPDALAWPSFMHHGGAGLPGEEVAYGLGSVDGLKVGFHQAGPEIADLDVADRGIDPAGLERVERYAAQWLPGVDVSRAAASTCLYTMTPNEDFVIAGQGPVIVLAGFSGHGFKFGPLVGEFAADLVEGKPGPSRFALGRTA